MREGEKERMRQGQNERRREGDNSQTLTPSRKLDNQLTFNAKSPEI